MRKIAFLFVAAAIWCATTIQAQNQAFRFGVKGGLNLSEFSLKSSDFDAENRMGFFVGPIVHISLPFPGIGLNIAGLYNQHEYKVNHEAIKHKTLDVPLNLRYSIGLGQTANVFVEAGPQIAFTLGDRALQYHDNDLGDVNWHFNDSDLSANIGGGLTFSHIQISVSYNVPLGKTGEFEWGRGTEDQLLHTKSSAKKWQIAAAFFF